MKNFLTGDQDGWPGLGYSYANYLPVRKEVVQRAPRTLFLIAGAATIWLIGGVGIGVLSAVRRRTLVDRLAMGFAIFGISVPVFWAGLMAIFVVWKQLGLTSGSGYSPISAGVGRWLGHLILPWCVLALAYMAIYARVTRNNLLATMGEDYIRTARAKGLPERADTGSSDRPRRRDLHSRGGRDHEPHGRRALRVPRSARSLPLVMELRQVGVVQSPLRTPHEAPRQAKGAPAATLVIAEEYADSLLGIENGQELIVLTWLDRADRSVQQVHPMDDLSLPLTGVFATRSSLRPNPIGVHPVTVTSVDGLEIRVDALEAIDGTPIIDIKCPLPRRETT